MQNALSTPGQIVSLSGPSKSGKTVLVERIVERENLIAISGASISSPEELWGKVLDWMDIPESKTDTSKVHGATGAGFQAGFPGIVKVAVDGKGGAETSSGTSQQTSFRRRGLQDVIHEIGNSDFVVLIDDFHYMKRDAQQVVAMALKEAVQHLLKVVTVTAHHRGDDVVRVLSELRGRVRSIDLDYWERNELEQIGKKGFDKLNVDVPISLIRNFAQEAAGSPQLMQLLCLQACFVLDIHKKKDLQQRPEINDSKVKDIFLQASSNTDFRTLVNVLDAGPRTRGTERKIYSLYDGTSGDVYKVILKALSADPPQLSYTYDQLLERIKIVCVSDVPVGSSVVGTCSQMAKLAQEKFPNERAIDWDDQTQVLDIPDPYLLFYLRWSNRLMESE